MNPLSSSAGAALAAMKLTAEALRHPLDIEATIFGSVVELRYGSHAEAVRALRELRALHGRALTPAARDVLAERERQQSVEGWTPEHDDQHIGGDLSAAAKCYAEAMGPLHPRPKFWPWARKWWKPKDRCSNLVRAAALLLAEIERLDRAAERAAQMETKA